MKLAFIDLETTGVDAQKNGIHQIAGILDIDGENVETFDFKVKPFPQDQIEDEALAVGNVTREQIANYAEPLVVKRFFEALLSKHVDKFCKTDKFHFIAYCANFDSQFLRNWFQKSGDNYYGSWFWHPPIDVMTLAAAELMENRATLPNFKLETVANRLLGLDAVNKSALHDATHDIHLTKLLYDCIRAKTDKAIA